MKVVNVLIDCPPCFLHMDYKAFMVYSKGKRPWNATGVQCILPPSFSCCCFATLGNKPSSTSFIIKFRKKPSLMKNITVKKAYGWFPRALLLLMPVCSQSCILDKVIFAVVRARTAVKRVSWIGFCLLHHSKALPTPVSRTFPTNESTKGKESRVCFSQAWQSLEALAIRYFSLFEHVPE